MASSPRRSRRKADQQIAEAWQRFYASPDGRVAVAEFLLSCSVYHPIETTDPVETHRMEGERRAALRLLNLLSLRPADFVAMAQDDTDILDRMLRQ